MEISEDVCEMVIELNITQRRYSAGEDAISEHFKIECLLTNIKKKKGTRGAKGFTIMLLIH